jgi:hypothetical protein
MQQKGPYRLGEVLMTQQQEWTCRSGYLEVVALFIILSLTHIVLTWVHFVVDLAGSV